MTDPITSRPKSATCAAMLAACLWAVSCPAAPAKPAGTPDNLALKATASASSEYSGRYRARFACDGKIPAAGSQSV